MKIFVAYGYNARDQWVRDLVFPLIRAFGDEVTTGEELQGEQITDAVRYQIQQSQALLAFITRREQIGTSDRWTTHRWVTDELSHALSKNLLAAEVREKGVDDQGGIAGDRQRIVYDENERDKCLVEIVKTIGKWHSASAVSMQLLPETFVEEIFPFLKKPGLTCTYQLLLDGEIGEEKTTTIVPIKGGLFVNAKNVPRQALIQVRVEYQGKTWISSFESTDSIGIRLRQG